MIHNSETEAILRFRFYIDSIKQMISILTVIQF